MFKKVLSYSVVGLLALALVAGMVYILLRPADAQARPEPISGPGQGRVEAVEPGTEYHGGGVAGVGYDDAPARGAPGVGRDGGRGQGQGANAHNIWDTAHIVNWETVTGEVTVVDNEITLQTAEGDVLVGLGQAWYREDTGFALQVGDEVSVTGFHEDGEFKAGSVENLTTGETLVLRGETGRPMWAGRGRLNNQR
ncbi:MAG: hypothetical protein ISS49_00315 [Anaerolineae bacterium]|nr:hypothetical protein [Anaerolineae bacterium]